MKQVTYKIIHDNIVLTEAQINLLKNRKNRGEEVELDFEKQITPEQTEKGLAWLMNKWKTPLGKERKNNPFGYREEDILKNFDHFTLVDFYNVSDNMAVWNMPVWRVYAHYDNVTVMADDVFFDYVVKLGEPYILS